jgi:hypothetical protein
MTIVYNSKEKKTNDQFEIMMKIFQALKKQSVGAKASNRGTSKHKNQ